MECWKETKFGFCCFGREEKALKIIEKDKEHLFLNASLKLLGRQSRVESNFINAFDETQLPLEDTERICELLLQKREEFDVCNTKHIKNFVRQNLLPLKLINIKGLRIPCVLDFSQKRDVLHVLSVVLARIIACLRQIPDKTNEAQINFIEKEVSHSNSRISGTPKLQPSTPDNQPASPVEARQKLSKGTTLSRRELTKCSKEYLNLVPLSSMNIYFKGIIRIMATDAPLENREPLLAAVLHASQNLLHYKESEDIAFKSVYVMLEENMNMAAESGPEREEIAQTEAFFKEVVGTSPIIQSLIEVLCSQIPQISGREGEALTLPSRFSEILRKEVKFVPIRNCNFVGLSGFNHTIYLNISENSDSHRLPHERQARLLGSMFHHGFEQALIISKNNLMLSCLQQNSLAFENIVGMNFGFQVEKFVFASLEIEYWRGEHGLRLLTKENWLQQQLEFPFGNNLDVEYLLLRFPRVVYFPFTFGLELKPKEIVLY